VAKLLVRLAGKRALVLAFATAFAVLNAKGVGGFKPLGFFDGPH
jgi:hypothetical protein